MLFYFWIIIPITLKAKLNQIKSNGKRENPFFTKKKTVATATTTATTTFYLFIINNITRFTSSSSSWSIVIHFPLLLLPHKQKVHYFLFRQFFFLLVFIAFYFCFYFSAKKPVFHNFFCRIFRYIRKKESKRIPTNVICCSFFVVECWHWMRRIRESKEENFSRLRCCCCIPRRKKKKPSNQIEMFHFNFSHWNKYIHNVRTFSLFIQLVFCLFVVFFVSLFLFCRAVDRIIQQPTELTWIFIDPPT